MSADERHPKLVASTVAYELWKAPRGVMRLDWTPHGAVRIIVVGHGYDTYAARVILRLDEALRNVSRVHVFFDFWAMETYESGLRTGTQAWGIENLAKITRVHILTDSKLVRMGATVASLALGGLVKVESNKREFDTQCKVARLPLDPPFDF